MPGSHSNRHRSDRNRERDNGRRHSPIRRRQSKDNVRRQGAASGPEQTSKGEGRMSLAEANSGRAPHHHHSFSGSLESHRQRNRSIVQAKSTRSSTRDSWRDESRLPSIFSERTQREIIARQAERRQLEREMDVEMVMNAELSGARGEVRRPIVNRSPSKDFSIGNNEKELGKDPSPMQMEEYFRRREEKIEQEEKQFNQVFDYNLRRRLQLLQGSESHRIRRFFDDRANQEKLKMHGISNLSLHDAMREIIRRQEDPAYALRKRQDYEKRIQEVREDLVKALNAEERKKNPEARKLLFDAKTGLKWISENVDERTVSKEVSEFTGGCSVPCNNTDSDDNDSDF
ncbi:hypothetical protein CAEBREN_11740 [Caenorhabditis brenneri]|uniref:Uncharacterized protein n=1 Tax=Caenorhabditis brenneri TaxID=135651 RepID=G0NID9_CAEBE|nr:hypothetical protein CAEBREN_11740 [Caenorhabditis brenneri]